MKMKNFVGTAKTMLHKHHKTEKNDSTALSSVATGTAKHRCGTVQYHCTKLLLQEEETEVWRLGLVSWLTSHFTRAVEVQTFEEWPLSLLTDI